MDGGLAVLYRLELWPRQPLRLAAKRGSYDVLSVVSGRVVARRIRVTKAGQAFKVDASRRRTYKSIPDEPAVAYLLAELDCSF